MGIRNKNIREIWQCVHASENDQIQKIWQCVYVRPSVQIREIWQYIHDNNLTIFIVIELPFGLYYRHWGRRTVQPWTLKIRKTGTRSLNPLIACYMVPIPQLIRRGRKSWQNELHSLPCVYTCEVCVRNLWINCIHYHLMWNVRPHSIINWSDTCISDPIANIFPLSINYVVAVIAAFPVCRFRHLLTIEHFLIVFPDDNHNMCKVFHEYCYFGNVMLNMCVIYMKTFSFLQ